MLAASDAKNWLARNAVGVKVLCNYCGGSQASACTSLISFLPALKNVTLYLYPLLRLRDDLGCLLEALAGCPRLKALNLSVQGFVAGEGDNDLHWPFPYAHSFSNSKMSSLTRLTLTFYKEAPCTLADVVGALVPLTGLVHLNLSLCQAAVVPAALGRFKGLQSLELQDLSPCVLEAGCLDLPNLLSLGFRSCKFSEDAEELPGVAALRRLTRVEITGDEGPRFFDPQLVQLPGLQHLALSCDIDLDDDVWTSAPARPLRLPANMGLLSLSLLHLDISWLKLPHFPLALTQLVALEGLDAGENEFVELPAGITALSRLTELKLGRVLCPDDPHAAA